MSSQANAVLKQIANANRKAEGWITTRNRLIVEANRSGAGLRAIADVCGLSHMSIKRIIEKEKQ